MRLALRIVTSVSSALFNYSSSSFIRDKSKTIKKDIKYNSNGDVYLEIWVFI